MSARNLLADAIALAARAHQTQVDKAGEPYILHSLRVMFRVREQGYRVEVQAAAVLHDVVEDTPITLDEVAALDPAVSVLVDAVTRRPREVYADFIRRAAQDPEARAIKLADVDDNRSRLDRLRPEEAEFLTKRYENALAILRDDGLTREPGRPGAGRGGSEKPMRDKILSGASAASVIALVFGGCAGAVASSYYYTWKCPAGSCRTLRADTAECVTESNKPYSPWIAGPAPRQGYFKTCMEGRGYVKLGQSESRPTEALAPGTGITRYGWNQ